MKKKEFKCKKCGKCCRYMILHFGEKASKDFMQWISLHEKTKVLKFNDGSTSVRFDLKCIFLRHNECMNYKNRPKVCREYNCRDFSF